MSRSIDEMKPEHAHDAAAPEELLAAYADDGLDGAERDAVARYLERHPERRHEVAALRDVIEQVRSAAPRPAREPEWDDMAARIRAACDEASSARAPERTSAPIALAARRGTRLRARVPRYAAAIAVAAAAAIAIAVGWRASSLREQSVASEATREGARREGAAASAIASDDEALAGHELAAEQEAFEPAERGIGTVPELAGVAAEADVEELAIDALDRALAALDSEGLSAADKPGDEDGAPRAPPLLPGDAADEWAEGEAIEYAIGSGLELFAEPDYEGWLEDLSEVELDALEHYLNAAQAG